MSTAHVRALLDHVAAELPPESWPHWTEGWPHEIEAGLLDAAFSARATYGTPTTGVRAVITRWRDHRAAPLDDLTALAGVPGFGPATWECLAMQLGIRTADSHRVVCEFLGEALDLETPPSTADAEHLVAEAAARLGITPATFTHAAWRYQRAQRRVAVAR
jgi:hypothetical protein